jgi:hypothetical protein
MCQPCSRSARICHHSKFFLVSWISRPSPSSEYWFQVTSVCFLNHKSLENRGEERVHVQIPRQHMSRSRLQHHLYTQMFRQINLILITSYVVTPFRSPHSISIHIVGLCVGFNYRMQSHTDSQIKQPLWDHYWIDNMVFQSNFSFSFTSFFLMLASAQFEISDQICTQKKPYSIRLDVIDSCLEEAKSDSDSWSFSICQMIHWSDLIGSGTYSGLLPVPWKSMLKFVSRS